ncbi:MAG: purine-nucleoside phosphorylase [Clostridia bacterium]|nr:purine-nucleoside phosphorylase [Clostridia bacterium]
MSTPHISANVGDFASTVLMPGDPLRAKYIAETYLDNAVLVNNVRGVQGYTGYYEGKRVSVMASGMGMPSMGIYSYELFKFYGVDTIIRVGSIGSIREDVKLRDIVIAQSACTNSNYASQFKLAGYVSPIADYQLMVEAVNYCEEHSLPYHVGNILSSDTFYTEDVEDTLSFAKMGVLGVEMETTALYLNAMRLGKRALTICTVSDSVLDTSLSLSSLERERSFDDMMKLALEVAK